MSRVAAWTPLGKDITGAKSIDEALRMAELDFEVQKQKVFLNKGGLKEIPGWFANVKSDDGTTLGMVTGKYKILQNKDAFEFVDGLVAEGMEFEKGGVFHCGKAVWVEAKLPGEYKILGDEVDSHICLVNSHDGKGSVKVVAIPLRLFCSNQLNFALKSAQRSWSVVHSSKVDARIAEARETLGLADQYMKALATEAERLATEKMSEDEFKKIIDLVYPVEPDASNRRLTNVAEVKSGLLTCLKAEDLANFNGTKWQAVGAVTDYFDHRDPQRNTKDFEAARWEAIINGHKDVDKLVERIIAA